MGRVGLSGFKYHSASETGEKSTLYARRVYVTTDDPMGLIMDADCQFRIGSLNSHNSYMLVVMMGKVGPIIVSSVYARSSCFKHYPAAWRVMTVVSSSCRAIREGCVCSTGRSFIRDLAAAHRPRKV